jgi:hypothetical protein
VIGLRKKENQEYIEVLALGIGVCKIDLTKIQPGSKITQMAYINCADSQYVLIASESKTESKLHSFELSYEPHLHAKMQLSINAKCSITGLYPGLNCVHVSLENHYVITLTEENLRASGHSCTEIQDMQKPILNLGEGQTIFSVSELNGRVAVILADCTVRVFDQETGQMILQVSDFSQPVELKQAYAARLLDDSLYILAYT